MASTLTGGAITTARKQQIFTTVGSTTWTVPAGVTDVDALIVGGGGSTWFAYSTTQVGGASGGMAIRRRVAVVPGTVMPVIVGAGGSALTVGVSNGSGQSSFNGDGSSFGGFIASGGRAPNTANGITVGGASAGPGSGAGGTSGGQGGDGLEGYGGGGGSFSNATPPAVGKGGVGAASGFLVTAATLPSGAPNSGAGAPGWFSASTAWNYSGGGGGSGIVILEWLA